MAEQVCLVDDQDGGPAPFGGFPGQDAPGLDGEGGGAVDGLAAEGGDDVGEDAADAGGGVADVDDGVAGGVEVGDGHRMATVLPVPTSPVTMQIVLSATAQAMRAAASPQSWWRCSLEGGRSRPNGMRASPNRVTTALIMSVLLPVRLSPPACPVPPGGRRRGITWPRSPGPRRRWPSPGSLRPGRWPLRPPRPGRQLLQGACGPAGGAERTAVSGDGLILPPAWRQRQRRDGRLRRRAHRPPGKAPVIEAALAHRTGRPRALPVCAVLTALLCLARMTGRCSSPRPPGCCSSSYPRHVPPAARRPRHRHHPAGFPGRLPPGPLLLRRHLLGHGPLGAAEEPAADPAGPQGPRQADDPRPGRSGPRPAGGVHQRPAGSQHPRPDRRNARPSTAAPAWTPPRSRCSPAARPSAPACAPAIPTAAGTSAKATTANARTTRASRCARSAWALEATIATMARPPGAPPAHPDLAIGLALARPGEDPGGTGARVLASAAARGHKAGSLGYDRAYTAALPGRFHLPARALGYQPVMDYRIDQLGIQANTGGAILVEGTWYCPALPEPLITATTGCATTPSPATSTTSRSPPAAPTSSSTKTAPTPTATSGCPAPPLGRHPGLICPLRQASLSPRDGRAKVLQPPPEPPRICRQTAITIAPDIGARYRQDLPYGSPAWHARTPPCATPSRASTATSKTPPTKPSPSPPAAASAASPPSPSSPRCCSSPPTSARSAPGGP